MNTRLILLSLILLCSAQSLAGQNGRSVSLSDSDVLDVRTTLGYSTILHFDARPTSVVLGDQDSFKVEYVGNSLTVKPLRAGASTNLFVFTDYDKFSFRITSSAHGSADYSIRIRRKGAATQKKAKPSSIAGLESRAVATKASASGVTLAVQSIAYPPSRTAVVVQFSITNLSSQSFEPKPFVAQQGSRIGFAEIRLTAMRCPPGSTVTGLFVVRLSKLDTSFPLELTLPLPNAESLVAPIDPKTEVSR